MTASGSFLLKMLMVTFLLQVIARLGRGTGCGCFKIFEKDHAALRFKTLMMIERDACVRRARGPPAHDPAA